MVYTHASNPQQQIVLSSTVFIWYAMQLDKIDEHFLRDCGTNIADFDDNFALLKTELLLSCEA